MGTTVAADPEQPAAPVPPARDRWRRRLWAWAPLVALAAGTGVLAGSVVALKGRATTARIGPNVVVNVPEGRDASNSPTLVANPVRRQNLVVVNRVDRPPYSARLHHSNDGGDTWRTTPLPLPQGMVQPFAPDAAFALDGTLYVAYVDLEPGGNRPAHLWVVRSEDGGATLASPVEVAGRLAFQPRLAIGPGGAVYLTWLQAAEVGVRAFVSNGSNPVVMARSDDGGRTFTPPVQVSDPERVRVGAAGAVVDRDGNVVVLYQDFKDDRRDFENLDGPVWEGPFALVATRSTDGGRTFGRGVEVDAGLVPTRRFLAFLPDFPSLAAAPDGSLYAAWADGRNGDDDVFLRRSTDGGRTWARPVRVNGEPVADGTPQFLPRVGVAPDGRVDVVYLDGSWSPSAVVIDVSVASSFDKGRSFRVLRVSSAPFDSRLGPKVFRGGETDFGTRIGLVSGTGRLSAVWADSRLADKVTQRQDIVLAIVSILRPPAQATAWGATVAMVTLGVLAAAGAGFSAVKRRRQSTVDS